MYTVAIIQLSGNTYFWVIKEAGKVIASSALIGERYLVEPEATSMSHQLGCGGGVTVEEREIEP